MINKITTIAVTGILLVFAVLIIFFPSREYTSEQNKFPKFKMEAFLSGEFASQAEQFLLKKFIFDDELINIKSDLEYLSGKRENNNIFINNMQLIERLEEPDDKKISSNIDSIIQFSINSPTKPYISIISSASEIQQSNLPKYASSTTWDQEDFLKDVYKKLNYYTENVELNRNLKNNSSDYIFYKTDSNWTTKAAYLSYVETGNYFNYNGLNLNQYRVENISNSFYGDLYTQAGFRFLEPDVVKKYSNESMENYKKIFILSNGTESSYSNNKEKSIDQYLKNDNAIVKIQTNNIYDEKILIFHDSLANNYAPFLMPYFSNIDMVNLKYLDENFKDYIRLNNYDYIYFLYSIKTFINSNEFEKLSGSVD